jgi:hypothetical protein
MALYLISYDLDGPDRDYSRLQKALADMGGTEILQSVYLVESPDVSSTLRDRLLPYMDVKFDRLVVVHVGVDSSAHNLINDEKAVVMLDSL